MKLLYVEDSTTLVKMVKFYLEQKGIEVFSCDNVDEAIEILENEQIDFILADIILRGTFKTGYILVREVKKDPKLKDIPIVLTSTRNAKSATITAQKVGADGFVEKPYNMDDLYKTIIGVMNESA